MKAAAVLVALLASAAVTPAEQARPPSSPAVAQAAVQRLARLGLPVYCGGATGRYVALTFDDGPGARTAAVLRLLGRRRASATFFLLGEKLAGRAALVRAEARLGAVGDHTWTHPFLTRISAVAAAGEIGHTQRVLAEIAGSPVLLFRPPYGFHDPFVDTEVRRLGMLDVLWSIDSHDSYPPPGAGAAEIATTVAHHAHPGSIVLLHENLASTAAALPRVLTALKRLRLHPVAIPQLLALDPPTPAQIHRGLRGCHGSSA